MSAQECLRLGRLQAELAAHKANVADRNVLISRTAAQLGIVVPQGVGSSGGSAGGGGSQGDMDAAKAERLLAALAARTQDLDRQCTELRTSNRWGTCLDSHICLQKSCTGCAQASGLAAGEHPQCLADVLCIVMCAGHGCAGNNNNTISFTIQGS